jgi:hypothetical protein
MAQIKSVEAAAYFYAGTVLVVTLGYISRVAASRFGYNFYPEVGLGSEVLLMVGVTVVYYAVFLLVQSGLSRWCRQILDVRYLFPAAFAAGIVVAFTLITELDFIAAIFYQRSIETIFLSGVVIEILFLFSNFAIAWRLSRA